MTGLLATLIEMPDWTWFGLSVGSTALVVALGMNARRSRRMDARALEAERRAVEAESRFEAAKERGDRLEAALVQAVVERDCWHRHYLATSGERAAARAAAAIN